MTHLSRGKTAALACSYNGVAANRKVERMRPACAHACCQAGLSLLAIRHVMQSVECTAGPWHLHHMHNEAHLAEEVVIKAKVHRIWEAKRVQAPLLDVGQRMPCDHQLAYHAHGI